MLNLFPIQFLSLFAYMLLRVFVGGVMLYLGLTHLQNRHALGRVLSRSWFPFGVIGAWYLALFEIVSGAMFIAGFYTQVAALIGIILCIKTLVFHRRLFGSFVPGKLFYVLLLGACVSLFITGGGAVAFDLPI